VANEKLNATTPLHPTTAAANDSAIWMQKDAHWSKAPVNSSVPNPFVQAQSVPPQANAQHPASSSPSQKNS